MKATVFEIGRNAAAHPVLAEKGQAGAVAAMMALVMGCGPTRRGGGRCKWVKCICEAAGVPKVTAHGMRDLHSTLAVEHGVSAHVVEASLGHESSTTTIQSYIKPEAVSRAQQRRVMSVLEGSRLASLSRRKS